MTRGPGGRIGLRRDLLLALTAAVTAWTAMLAWRGFTENPDRFLVPLLLIGLAVAVTGAAARALSVPGLLVVALQTLVAASAALRSMTGSWVPGPTTLAAAEAVLAQAGDSATRYAAPVDGSVPPVEPILLVAGLGCLLLVDVVATTLRRVPLAGLPLLTVYTLPVSMLGGTVSWWAFALPAAGFTWMLYQHTAAELDRWDAGDEADGGTGRDAAGFGVRTGGVRGTALGLGAAATGLAVAVPLVVPTLSLAVFDGGPGGDGTDEISLDNPMTDLRRDLRRPDDTPLLRVTTADPDPSYLRISVLNRFSDEAWTSGDRDLPDGQSARGAQPAPQGVSADVPRRTFPWRIEVADEFGSTWLPTPYPLARVEAAGAWKYDAATRDFIAAEEGLTTAGLSYDATALELEFSAEELAQSSPGSSAVGAEFLELPDDLPLEVRQLAQAASSGAATDFGRAVALQQWFRRDGGFTYDLSADEGNGTNALVQFLSDTPDGRTGYCEQFASAMAVMARSLDIPARVAVGFLQPDPVLEGDRGEWEYSSDDLHAWPELYFPGSGWVRFEPTPAGRAEDVPAYTRGVDGVGETPDVAPGPGEDQIPDQGGGSTSPDGGGAAAPVAGAVTLPDGLDWRAVGLLAGVPALLVVLLLAPMLLRAADSARRRRTSSAVEAAWTELAALVVDFGRTWPAGRSPGETRDLLAPGLGGSEPRAALDRLVAAVEVARYSRAVSGHEDTAARRDLDVLRTALTATSSRRRRLVARWFPRSLVRRPVGQSARRTAPTLSAPGVAVDRLG